MARGLHTADQAYALVTPGSDPHGDIWIGVIRTDILLRSGGSAEEVEAAGEPGLAVAASTGIDSWQAVLVRSNISEALTRAGFVGRAAALIDPVTEVPFDIERWPVHLERAHLDALRGCLDAARDRLSALRDDSASLLYRAEIEARKDLVNYAALVDLWDAAPEQALSLVKPFLDDVVGTEAVALGGRPSCWPRGPRPTSSSRSPGWSRPRRAPPGPDGPSRPRRRRPVHDDHPRRWSGSWGDLASRDRPPRGSALAGAVGHGRRRVGQTQPAARRGVLQVARRAGRAGDRPRHHRSAATAPRQPARPASTYPSRQPSPRRPSVRCGHPVRAERRVGCWRRVGDPVVRCASRSGPRPTFDMLSFGTATALGPDAITETDFAGAGTPCEVSRLLSGGGCDLAEPFLCALLLRRAMESRRTRRLIAVRATERRHPLPSDLP